MSTSHANHVPRVHIVGRKNAGKTTLVCELVAEFQRREIPVATVKHTHHAHELDTPGKDSHQHRTAGAAGVGILSPGMTAAFVPTIRAQQEHNRYRPFQIMFSDCRLILVEGDLQTSAPRIEVWRSIVSEPPYAAEDPQIERIVSDDDVSSKSQRHARSDVAGLADWILQRTATSKD
ncbi:MAG: molybdopterin-guanine dinucleotide biosynthesis protein B [Fuerstiella sp.]